MIRIVAILAGGKSSRMGADKAEVALGGARLIDRAIARLAPQADRLIISGPDDRRTGLVCAPDDPGDWRGPAAGVFAIARWVRTNAPAASAFFTAPVDGPFVPRDLIARLAAAQGPAIAADEDGPHPTFACWTLQSFERARSNLRGEVSPSLFSLAAAAGAVKVFWPGRETFLNINAPEDLVRCARIARMRADR